MTKSGAGKSKPKVGRATGSLTGRQEVHRALSRDRSDWWRYWKSPETYTTIGLMLIFVVGISTILLWIHRQPLVSEGQIAFRTQVARVAFDVYDKDKTEKKQELARKRATRYYDGVQTYLDQLQFNLLGLPTALAGKTTVEEVNPDLVSSFSLTPESLLALQHFVDDQGEVTAEWRGLVTRFIEVQLYTHPIIDSSRYQIEWGEELPATIVLRPVPDVTIAKVRSGFINIADENIDQSLSDLARVFPLGIRTSILTRLKKDLTATYIFNEPATIDSRTEAAGMIEKEYVHYDPGHVLFERGDRLSAYQVDLVVQESEQYTQNSTASALWSDRLGTVGFVLLITLLLTGTMLRFHPRMIHKPIRVLSLVLLSIGLFVLTCASASVIPNGLLFVALAPTLLLAIIATVAYGQRYALTIGSLYPFLVCYGLDLPVGYTALMIGSIGVNVFQLNEIRDRDRLIYAGAVTGLFSAGGAIVLSLAYRPVVDGFLRAMLLDALSGVSAGLVIGIFTLGILSTIERLFNVTTGLTLVELRDPKQPVLRELLQRAPGTYNHSVQVANLAEAAAEAIGANSLLTYVGSLYHDIGKMNKPSYFVENQIEGENRHKKLSPAMSLLIIVGHVKDGLEIAREHGLPKPLHHFIEAHHGTTLVEYFYHVAKEKAEAGDTNDQVEEVKYRYPGPKPVTREVAIVMLSDSVESASRAMSDPTPARIEQLVRKLGEKRLIDEQFDRSDLTLRELRMIEDSLVKSLCATHHARVSYPSDEKHEDERKEVDAKEKAAV